MVVIDIEFGWVCGGRHTCSRLSEAALDWIRDCSSRRSFCRCRKRTWKKRARCCSGIFLLLPPPLLLLLIVTPRFLRRSARSCSATDKTGAVCALAMQCSLAVRWFASPILLQQGPHCLVRSCGHLAANLNTRPIDRENWSVAAG